VINACAGLGAHEDNIHVHEHINQSGCEPDVFVGCIHVDKLWEHGGCWDYV